MIQVENLLKEFGERVLFDEVCFQIQKGERCLVAGRNGSGKSTLLKILEGELEADSGKVVLARGTKLGSLPQHLEFSEESVLAEVAGDESWRAEIILEGLGFTLEEMQRPPESFSGGYQLRIALARVLVQEPDLLILDEPTNYLDVLAIRWLEQFLREWQRSVLFVSHDKSFADSVATHVLGIKRGKAKKMAGNLTAYRTQVALEEETHERRRVKLDAKRAHMESYIERFGSKASKAAQAQSKLKALEKMEQLEALENEQQLNFRFAEAPCRNKVLLEAKEICFSYEREVPLIRGFSCELERGERLAVVGKNGSGKSTLIKLLFGELNPQQGELKVGVNTQFAYFGQTNIDRLSKEHTIEEELIAAAPGASPEQVRSAAGAMLFSGDDFMKPIEVLSGGERSRVLLAKILLSPANLLLLDEPTHHLDVESVEALMLAIQQFTGAVVLVAHDEEALCQFHADKLLICHEKGQEKFLGDYPLFLEKRGWEEEKEKIKTAKPKKERKESDLKKEQKLIKRIEKLEAKQAEIEEKLCAGETEFAEKYESLLKEIEEAYNSLD